ncbi:MAG: MFS transporter [Anaerolineae bacterium]
MENRRDIYKALLLTNFLLFFGFNLWRAIFNNFAVEELGVQANQIGLIQSLREIPGLIGFSVGFLALFLAEINILGLSVMLLGAGLAATGWAYDFASLILGTLVMSVGFHFFFSSSSSVVLMLATKDESPKVLGRLRSIGSFAAVVATIMVFLIVEPLGYRGLLYLAGGVTFLGGLVTFLRSPKSLGVSFEQRIIFRRRYMLYYVLTFLMGSRRHIFTTFAIFLLVSVHGISAQQTAILFLVNSLLTTYAYQQLGRLVSRFGERRILTVNFILLALVFLGYAYISYLPILYLLFVIDNILFGLSITLSTYFQKIATPEEITSNISMAQTINHVAALFVPAAGGVIWTLYGPQATFLAGVAIVLISLVLTQRMPLKEEPQPAFSPAAH